MAGFRLRLAVATTHAEGSISAIARAATRQHALVRFYTTVYTPGWARFAPRVPGLRRRLLGGRRSFAGIDPATVETHATSFELLRMAAMRVPRMQHRAAWAMYEVDRRFDAAVAQTLDPGAVDAVVAMYTSAEATTAAAGRHGILSVLNVISAYPAERNRLLTELAGLPGGHHELLPERTALAVERALRAADLLLVPSQFVRSQLVDAGTPESKILLRRFGVDVDRFSALAGSPRFRPAGNATVTCLFVGQVGYIKGVPVLLEAARRLLSRPVDFRIVGPVVSAEVLRDLPRNVVYDGPLGHADVARAMLAADVFVLPSLVDVFPLAVVEAMACGLPAVVTANSGAAELLDQDTGMVVGAGDVAALTAALERLIDDRELRVAMGEAARARMYTASWESYGDDVLDMIAERIASSSGPPFVART